jgi:hypothetical protein
MRKTALIIMIFLLIGGYIIYSSLDTNFKDSDDRQTFFSKYFSWLFQVGKSTKNTVGFAFEQDWLPKTNLTNKTVVVE